MSIFFAMVRAAERMQFEAREPGAVESHFHDGAEFRFELDGQVGIASAGEESILASGDCIYFDASLPHGHRATGAGKAAAIMITTPPGL